MDMARSEVRKLAGDDYTTARAPRARGAAGAPTQLPGFPDRRRRRASLRERVLQGGVRVHREPGHPPAGARILLARQRALDARRHGRLSGHRRAHHAPPAQHESSARENRPASTPRHRHDAGMDGRDGRRLFLPVPDADAVPRHSTRRSRSRSRWRGLQSLALRAHPRGRAAHRLDALSAVQRSRRRLQDRARSSATGRAWSASW